jgi:hydrophobe/amphiphile efflux-1 (HAE1) family protein
MDDRRKEAEREGGLSAPFIKRPVATSLLAAAVLLAGGAAYFNLPVAPLPDIDFPTVSVSAALPGASPDTMASAVATPLERRFGRIAGLSEMTSTSSLGNTQITMQFDLSRDVSAAARDVQAAINAAGGELPANLPTRPNYRKVNPADSPILILSLRSDTLPLAQVFDAANSVLAQKMSQIEGVGQVFVGGGQQPAVRVQIDGQALANMGLSSADVRGALAASTSNQPKGLISGPRTTYSVAANDQLLGAEAYRPLVISFQNGAAVRLGDVAKVFDDVENNRLAAWIDGKRAVLMIVRRQPGANILATLERIKEALPRLRESISPAIETKLVLDRTETIRASVRDVERTLVLSVVLVTLVVFLFLRSARATVIPSVAVPLSLVGTFGVMYLLGYSLDNLSLMALATSTGFVVDDAIVVTENIARTIEEGAPPLRAALLGAKQIGFTIVSITVSLIAVFIPILLMGGIIGRLFREFAVTLSVAIVISALVSLTVTPTMAAYILRPAVEAKRSRLFLLSERFLAALQHGYDRGITWVLDHARLMLALTVATVGVTVWLAIIVPKGLFPQQDTGLVSGFSEASQDISSTAMRNLQEKVNAIVQADPDVGHTISFFGGQSGSGNTGTIFVPLKPYDERKSTSDEVIARLRPKLAKTPGMTLFLQSVQDLRIGGRGSRTQYQYTLQDANLEELRAWAPRMLEALRKLPDLRDVNTDQQTAGLELDVAIDRDSAARLGVTMGAIDDALYDAYGQRQVATSYTASNYYRVVLEATPDYQSGPDELERIFVRSTTGAIVPLRSVAKFSTGLMPLGITHQGQFPSVTLSFNLAPGKALGDAIKAIDAAERRIGVPASISAGFSGTAQAFGASLASEPWLILAALVSVYLVLGILYESLVHPLTILSTLPSAAVGALIALLVAHLDFSIIALIGVVLLLGIVKKNAIMMIDFALEAERAEGIDPKAAIHRACLLRFRPILMTTLAALFGAIPLAVGFGAGSELRRPLGIAIVGGLAVSQLLNLFTTPVIYLFLDRLRLERRRPVPTAPIESPAGA